MTEEFTCKWEHPKYFSIIKMKNMKSLFKNLEIELKDTHEETVEKRVFVTFTLMGTKEQQERLDYYMKKIHTLE